MIREAPAAFAPSATYSMKINLEECIKSEKKISNQCIPKLTVKLTASPTVPRPKTATVEPDSTFAVFQTAPRP